MLNRRSKLNLLLEFATRAVIWQKQSTKQSNPEVSSMRNAMTIFFSALTVGCATIVNDPNIPLTFTFSDGSAGHCEFKNKRGAWSADLPATNVMIRRSDDALLYECTTEDGREVSGSIRSEVEGEKMAASVIFWDFGITDAITDKHRTYQGNVVIPVPKVAGSTIAADSGEKASD